MTRLESRPANNRTWDYNFFIDIDGHITDDAIAGVLKEVRATVTFMYIIGSYEKSQLS